ncbi:NAD(P)H-dependent oxidoreductase subunit E [Sulfurisoma sediminicola]|uniref:NAD(P)-dependent nickel-iron dehydrogenase flavin-containing subunit n=1 Tax=Sulfurisoma sediminicola TaxID=1381557 RepID=A0A497X8Z9_9PROT|nr:NAD(P)H-dependent oxidoreductase subunit E [Sulfurisoma sediminicola]RLJ61656.1 NAD(P)-dependent nickel-iron dehydrogenase flavin-containing subunit [Sulfurisoma sediminicola]
MQASSSPQEISTALPAILARHGHDGTRLMQILREAQEAEGWLSPALLTEIARAVGRPRAEVEGTAAFYSFFHTRPRGKYCVLWSDNITDRMLGNRELLKALCSKLWLEPGRLSEDGLVSVNTTSCTGMCDQGPAVLVNYRAITRMTMERVDAMAELIRNQVPLAEWPAEWFAVEDNVRRADILLSSRFEPGSALRAAVARASADGLVASNDRSVRESLPHGLVGPTALLDEIRLSNLRGRGGAGFSTRLKWEACRNAPLKEGQTRIVICNADEGEPGTFKDRVLLTSHADLVFEGMTVAAYAVGATRGFVYLRGEYRYLLEPLQEVLARRRAAGLLGRNILGIPGADFDIEVHLGAGAYICGEESALIESLEGKPGRPRIRPPFPVTHGYLEQPTIVNNVETFACAALIALKGGEWFATIGTRQSTGTKILSVSGDVERPGLYEYPFGVSVAEVLQDCGVTNCIQAVQVSGPSGVCIGQDELDRKIGFEDIPTAGALMVFDCTRDMFDVAHNFAHFFAHESCGFCTPCRVGTQIVARLMDKLASGHGSPYDINEMFKMHRLMQGASHCGLGNTACNPMIDTLTKFKPAYERRLKSLDFVPGFDLDAALSQARQMTGRDDAAAHLAGTD